MQQDCQREERERERELKDKLLQQKCSLHQKVEENRERESFIKTGVPTDQCGTELCVPFYSKIYYLQQQSIDKKQYATLCYYQYKNRI